MTQATPVPSAIRLDVAGNVLAIDWRDGTRARYAGAYLRHLCPCAACRGHAPGEKEPPSWAQVRDVRVTGASMVGTYALRLDFTDGHATGIYSFAWLRDNVPARTPGVDDLGRPIGHEDA